MEKIISENAYQKTIQNPDGSVKIIQKKKENWRIDNTWRFQISKRRWFEEWKELTPTQRSIMLSLWLYAGKKRVCWASMRRLAGELKVERNTILRNIKVLKKKRYFKIEKTIGQRGRYNKYFLLK